MSSRKPLAQARRWFRPRELFGQVGSVPSGALWLLCFTKAARLLGPGPQHSTPQAPRVRPRKEDPEASTCQESPGDGDSAATCPEDTPPVRPVDTASTPPSSAFTPQS